MIDYELSKLRREKIGAKPLTKEEWFEDWKYENRLAKVQRSYKFRFGKFLFRFSKKIKSQGWKLMIKAENKHFYEN